MAKIVFNPPPGWAVVPEGWIPHESGSRPRTGHRSRPGWPLFVTVRSWPRTLVFWLLLFGSVGCYAALMERAGTPLTRGSYGLVALVLVVGCLASVVKTGAPTPVSRWPWMPSAHAVGVRPRRHELEPDSWRFHRPRTDAARARLSASAGVNVARPLMGRDEHQRVAGSRPRGDRGREATAGVRG